MQVEVCKLIHQEENLMLPPQAIEAEQSVLGSILINNDWLDTATEFLAPADFYRHDHQKLYEEILTMSGNGEPVDVVTLSERLSGQGKLDQVGGLKYINALARNTPNTGNVRGYSKIVKERSVLRGLIDQCNNAIQEAYQGGESSEVLSELAKNLDSLETSDSAQQGLSLAQIAPSAVDAMEARFNSQSELIGISTGLHALDQQTAGFCDKDLIVVAARPSMGKTAFALSSLIPCVEDGGVALFFSMEMPSEDLYNRMWSNQSRVPLQKIRQPKDLTSEDWTKLTAASETLNKKRVIIDDQAGLNVNQIRARARKTKRKQGQLDLVVIDYLQLMKLPNKANKADEIGDVTRSLKGMAKDLGCPVILLSQLNRSLESRPNKRPVMSDLRDSGAIEQDADLIIFLYRDEYYNPDTQHKGICEIALAKFRNGETGIVRSIFLGAVQRFEDFKREFK
jgi:replicative DNA helicase